MQLIYDKRSLRSWSIPVGLLLVTFIVYVQFGAIYINGLDVIRFNLTDMEQAVLFNIRIPRAIGAFFIGGMLAVAGAGLQGLFRNPLVDAGIIGVTTGASFAAVCVISLSAFLPVFWQDMLGVYLLPFFAFLGSLFVCYAVYVFGKQYGSTNVAMLILAGIAINAILGALTGLVIYFSDDTAIRSFTFWSMGELAGISWSKLTIIIPIALVSFWYFLKHVKILDVLSLGENEAFHLGVNLSRKNKEIILFSALAVGAAVAFCGAIGFVGLVVPHIVRTAFGASHQRVIPISIVLGGLLLMWGDLFARTIVQPSELPIGIITSVIGGPFFMYLLIQYKRK